MVASYLDSVHGRAVANGLSVAATCTIRQLDAFLATHEEQLIDFRRTLHMHPELGFEEHLTTQRIADRLSAVGLHPVLLPKTGLICDIGPEDGPTVVSIVRATGLPMSPMGTSQ